MDYREELLNKILVMMNNSGITEIEKIRSILIRAISDYQVSARCTDIAVVDNSNVELVKLFLATKKVEGGSDRTAQTRMYVIRKFNDFINKPFAEVTTFDILRWLINEQKRVSLSTAESYRAVISSLFTWLKTSKIISDNPMETVKPIKHPEVIKKSFTSVEVDALKAACNSSLERAMIELLLSSGLRCEELCNLKWSNIDFVTKDIDVIEGKGNKNRITMMDDVTKKYLLEYKKSLDFESPYVFAVKYRGQIKERTTDSVWSRLKSIAARAGIEEVNPHKFRHTFATTLYKRGLDTRMIQKLLGHATISTTMIYIDSDLDMLRDAYKRCV